jgi:hypothetical protein
MKKIFFSLLLMLPFLMQAQLVKTLKKTIELKMPGKVYKTLGNGLDKPAGEDSMPGKRGGAVVWHPLQKKYYAAFAGNKTFPLAVFDVTGKLLSEEDETCLVDTRGLWYNPKIKKICGNGYSDIGWFSHTLDAKGIPTESNIDFEGMNQPGEQSIGVFNAYAYNKEAMQEEDSTIRLYPGISKKEDIDEEDDGEYLSETYSSNVLIYTGIPKAEFGLLNVNETQVELYNKKTGLLTQILKLPSEVVTYGAFNFSYTNGTYWAFNMDTRTWTGYK